MLPPPVPGKMGAVVGFPRPVMDAVIPRINSSVAVFSSLPTRSI
ncbi:hypothetical protein [Protofrankia coriariae]|nr:hypothetical protein [Protofrankia coriariae]